MGIHANNRDARLARTYCDGVAASVAGDLQNTNPWTQATDAEQYAAWDQGWLDHNGAAVDLSCCGVPAAGKPPPEILNAPRY